MEVKKDLNNTQRKMLDEIYTERFKVKVRLLSDEREEGLRKLKLKVLKDVVKGKDVKRMLEVGKTFYELQEKLGKTLDASGLKVENTLSHVPEVKFGSRYYGSNYGEHPEIAAYNAETRKMESVLAEKKKEMRAKIYGVSASYEEIDKEISELLKGV